MSIEQIDQVEVNEQGLDQGTEAQVDLSAEIWQEMDQQPLDTSADKPASAALENGVLDFDVDDPFGLPEETLTASHGLEEEEETLQAGKEDDEIKVDDKRTVLKDGSVRTEYDDGSKLTKDPDGKVTEITHPDGKKATVEYDENGDEKALNFPDGSKWQKTEEGNWNRVDKDGKVIDSQKDVSVTEDGDIIFIPENDAEPIQVDHRDGKDTYIHPDGSQITRNADGKVESITHPDGKTATVEYDENGDEKALNLPDGSKWQKTEKGNWNRIDKNGKVIDSQKDVSVTEDGDIIFIPENDAEPIQVDHRDGKDTFIHTDGSQITRNADGKVESITHPDGKTATVEYDENGDEKALNFPDGSQWKRQADGSWNRTDADGNVTDSVMAVQVTGDGDIIFIPQDEKEPIQIDHRNGNDTFIPQNA